MQRVRFEYGEQSAVTERRGDGNQLEQVLTNLILNAAQASPDDGLVRLTTTAQPDGVRLTVEDRGQGWTRKSVGGRRSRFLRRRRRARAWACPICRKIVETHGGKLSIGSVVGKGTEVVVDLPRQQPASEGMVHDDPRSGGRGRESDSLVAAAEVRRSQLPRNGSRDGGSGAGSPRQRDLRPDFARLPGCRTPRAGCAAQATRDGHRRGRDHDDCVQHDRKRPSRPSSSGRTTTSPSRSRWTT